MLHRPTTDPTFRQDVEAVHAAHGEIVSVFRFSAAAGARSYEIFEDVASFFARLDALPQQTSVIVFKTKQFPVRGIADEDLLHEALAKIPDGAWWNLTRTTLITMGSQSWYPTFEGDSLTELEEELKDELFWGHPVAIGPEPDFHDLEQTVDAIVPDEDGRVTVGVY
jgi:hypothetical protein